MFSFTLFALAASGHIAGSINPASRNRRSYWINESEAFLTPAESRFRRLTAYGRIRGPAVSAVAGALVCLAATSARRRISKAFARFVETVRGFLRAGVRSCHSSTMPLRSCWTPCRAGST